MQLKLLFILLISFIITGSAGGIEWQDESVIGINKERPHATLMPYASIEQALKGQAQDSCPYQKLHPR